MKRKPRQKKKPRYTKQQVRAMEKHTLKMYKADDSHAKELGYALVQLRASLRYMHDSFTDWCTTHKLTQSRVSYCMRLAQGKVAAAKAKQRSAFQGAAGVAKKIRKEINDFLAFAIRFDMAGDADPVYEKLALCVGNITVYLGELPGWKMRDINHLHVEKAAKSCSGALRNLMRNLYNEQTPHEKDPVGSETIQPIAVKEKAAVASA
jgi:hypothetical protein